MSTNAALAHRFHHFEGEIGFIVPGPHRPFAYNYDAGPDAPPETVSFIGRTVALRDVRNHAPLSMDINGATLLRRPTVVRDLYDPTEITRRYYPETAEIIASAVGAQSVIVFDHNVRRGSTLPSLPGQKKPVQHAHTDFTPQSALRRARALLGPESNTSAHRRFAQ